MRSSAMQAVQAVIVGLVSGLGAYAATMTTAAQAAWMTLFLPDRAWWLIAVFTAPVLITLPTLLSVRERPGLSPAIVRLSAPSGT